MPFFNNKGGEIIGEMVAAAYDAQVNGAFSAHDEAMVWLANHLQKQARLVRGAMVVEAGVTGAGVKTILDAAWAAQLMGAYTTVEGAQEWVNQHVRTLREAGSLTPFPDFIEA